MESQKTITQYTILGSLEGIWEQGWSMNSRNRIITCYRGNSRLLDKAFEMKSIKERGKIPNQYLKAT